jgi:hypothetical protein
MAGQFRCGARMDGSGAGAASSSPNRPLSEEIVVLSTTQPARPGGLLAIAAGPVPFEHGSPEAGRTALPAGHPLSWGPLTAGTVLDGAPYAHTP